MFSFYLVGNSTYKWTYKDKYMFVGYCFDKDNHILREEEALQYLINQIESEGKINGIYTLIKQDVNSVAVYSDTVNYFPVFYCNYKDNWIVSDSWNNIVEIKGGIQANTNAEAEFSSAGFVLNNETLDINIFKTIASEKLSLFSENLYKRESTYNFIPDVFSSESFTELQAGAKKTFNNIGLRIKEFLGTRTAVLPLSGGFDSRLIACILKEQNIENVICFTYGKMNAEVSISKKVAETLGYKWHFIDYADLDLDGYLESKIFIEYAKNAGNGFSMPYLQEYFAVKFLKEKGLIPNNAVFLPGHSGDYLGGSYVEKTIKTSLQNKFIASHVRKSYFVFTSLNNANKSIIEQRIATTFSSYPPTHTISKSYSPYLEDWDIKEKLSKFIFRSSYVFNYFGHEHLFPLWDKELLDFFRDVPYIYRKDKALYDSLAIEEYFTPLNVYFEGGELNKSRLYKIYQKIKDKIRYFFPWSYVLKRMIKSDWINYYKITEYMEEALIKKKYPALRNYKYFNAIICRWYLDFNNCSNKD